ncbi:MAG: phytoene/squalene synthase family protein [Burkholderiaceae bacterium]
MSASLPAAGTLTAARAVLRNKGRSFHWAKHLLSITHADRATRLYSLCRYLDDLADEPGSVDRAREQLGEIQQAVRAGQSSNPVIRDGLLLMQECGIDSEVLCELIEGVTSDLAQVAINNLDELLQYCYQVAGTVGLMMCSAIDVKNPAAWPHAVDLGIAMQLTNICRDVKDDALANRRYLPATLLGEAGAVEPAALIAPHAMLQPQLQHCVQQLLGLADRYYRSGELGLSYLPLGARTGILTAARLYRAIGMKIRDQQHGYWLGRAVVSPGTKAAITAGVVLSAPLVRGFWRPTSTPDLRLYRPRAHRLPQTSNASEAVDVAHG